MTQSHTLRNRDYELIMRYLRAQISNGDRQARTLATKLETHAHGPLPIEADELANLAEDHPFTAGERATDVL